MMPLYKNKNRRGQTLVIALMVMFILAIIGAIFIVIVAKNLFRSERYSNADAVAQIAEAGIRYADEMLTTSEEGADWRPTPDDCGAATHAYIDSDRVWHDATKDATSGDNDWQTQQKNNPDWKWVRPYSPTESSDGFCGPSGGFTTVNSGDGRFLIRVSYNPDPKDPLSKYIKIESIGRLGTIDPTDPTTLKSGGNTQLRREITAFKPIGITDDCRFITNKDNRSADIPLGVPGYHVNIGRPESDMHNMRGGPIRVNGNLLWYGNYYDSGADSSIDIYLRGAIANDAAGATTNRTPIDSVEASGDIKMDIDPSDSNKAVRVMVHTIFTDSSNNGDSAVYPSDDDDRFTTLGGFYRDGSDNVDIDKNARGVKRIEPPLVDQTDSTGTTTRYRLLTLNSGARIQNSAGKWVNLGKYGWGRGVYINNPNDKQDESDTLVGGYTLRADLLKPNSPLSSYWKGPYYVPPGAIITLLPNDSDEVDGHKQYYFTITRTDTQSQGQKAAWYDYDGNIRQDWGSTVRMPYPDPFNGRYIESEDGIAHHIDGNGVIYAEGNIRIRGMLPEGMQLTIVSNHNIYIEGNLLKYRDSKSTYTTDNSPDTTGGLSLLARENIVVNTTQFFSPLNNVTSDDVGSDTMDNRPPFHVTLTDSPESNLRCMFEFGPWDSNSQATSPDKWWLFLRHSGEYGPAYINCWLNPSQSLTNWGVLYLNSSAAITHTSPPNFPVNTLPSHIWGVGDPRFGSGSPSGTGTPSGAGVNSLFACDVFKLDLSINATLNEGVGQPNIVQLALDQSMRIHSNYWMGGLAVQPMDVRIEAVLYAQEGSFFVIPGNWFNPNSSDVEGELPDRDPMFPYYGQPLDIRITIDGAVSENMPAAISDVEEWMAKWGKIPEYYGSSNVKTAHPGEGLTFLYDDRVGWPLVDLADTKPIRWDSYGRTLPITPRLPVCSSLIYFGDVM